MSAITEIEGVGPAMAEKLQAAGIKTVEALLSAGATAKERAALVESTGISLAQLTRWVNHADLFRLKGVGSQFAELLEAAGVDSVPELAQRNAANLRAKMAEVNAEKKLTRAVPTEAMVEAWVAQAKTLDRVVSH
jgi:predicted flap endonuclease-1-like 5' DNA nuclease